MTTAMEATHNALCDEEVRYAIEARDKAQSDRITELNAAVEDGETRGEMRGEARGRAEVARALQAQGFFEEVIFKATGLRLTDL